MLEELLTRSSWGAMFAARNDVSTEEALTWIGILLVVICLGLAAYMAYLTNWLATVLLLVVAIFAAFLLL